MRRVLFTSVMPIEFHSVFVNKLFSVTRHSVVSPHSSEADISRTRLPASDICNVNLSNHIPLTNMRQHKVPSE